MIIILKEVNQDSQCGHQQQCTWMNPKQVPAWEPAGKFTDVWETNQETLLVAKKFLTTQKRETIKI